MSGFRVWVAAHDNGWETWIAHRADGTFAAWITGPLDCHDTRYRYDLQQARTAAMFLLHEHTGHRCSRGCSHWAETAKIASLESPR